MTAQTAKTMKYTIGILVSLTVLLSFTFALGVGFAKNGAEHSIFNTELERSIASDKTTAGHISTIQGNVQAIQTTMSSMDKTIEKIEKKLP